MVTATVFNHNTGEQSIAEVTVGLITAATQNSVLKDKDFEYAFGLGGGNASCSRITFSNTYSNTIVIESAQGTLNQIASKNFKSKDDGVTNWWELELTLTGSAKKSH
jgi:hypothetical protein